MNMPKEAGSGSSYAATRKKIDIYRNLLDQKQQREQQCEFTTTESTSPAPNSPEAALEHATNKLHLLADLIEAHFVDSNTYLKFPASCKTMADRCEELQKKAIRLARTLANENYILNKNSHYWVNANVKFQHLFNTLVRLKSFHLVTSYGEDWSDIIRPVARDAANAYTQHYQMVCSQFHTEEDEAEAESQMRYVSITGSNAYAELMARQQKNTQAEAM